MITPTNKRHFPKMIIVMTVLLASAGVFSCNNAAEEKKEAPAVVDTAAKVTVDTTHHVAADTPKNPIDTIKDTKVPPPPKN